MFFVSVAYKRVTEELSVSVGNKEVICTILGQFCRVFVSVANAGVKVPVFSIDLRRTGPWRPEAPIRIPCKVNTNMYTI